MFSNNSHFFDELAGTGRIIPFNGSLGQTAQIISFWRWEEA